MLFAFHFEVSSQTCNDKNYLIAKEYDVAFTKNSNSTEKEIRDRVAKKYKINSDNLRAIYFSCLERLDEELPLNEVEAKPDIQCNQIKKITTPSPIDALAYADKVEGEIKNGQKLFKKRPTTAEIGKHSLKMKGLLDLGRNYSTQEIFEQGYDSCAGLGSAAWSFWFFSMIPKYTGGNFDEKEYKQLEKKYKETLKECRDDADSVKSCYSKNFK